MAVEMRVIYALPNQRAAYQLGHELMEAGLVNSMNINAWNAVEPWASWPRAQTDVSLALLVNKDTLATVQSRVTELSTNAPPECVGYVVNGQPAKSLMDRPLSQPIQSAGED